MNAILSTKETQMRYLSIALTLALICASAAFAADEKKKYDKPGDMKIDPNKKYTATIDTSEGKIVAELNPKVAPQTVNSFVFLAKEHFYDGTIFHRVIKGFMIQGGDPTGTGTGGESAWGGRFNDEIDSSSALYQRGYKKGTVAMANAGPNTNGSQFFIVHADYPLPPSNTIFGRVTEGQDVVNAIATTETDRSDRPTSEVKMESVSISE